MGKPEFRYSEAFKLQVLGDLEQGTYGGVEKVAKAYGIKGNDIVLVRYCAGGGAKRGVGKFYCPDNRC